MRLRPRGIQLSAAAPFQQSDGQIQGLPLILGIPARYGEPVLRPPQDKGFLTLLAGLSEGAGHGERKA